MTKEELLDWCNDYCKCYSVTIDGCIYNTGECPHLIDNIAESIMSSNEVLDVTKDATVINRQLQYEVEHNGCKLYKVVDNAGYEIIISYFTIEDTDE